MLGAWMMDDGSWMRARSVQGVHQPVAAGWRAWHTVSRVSLRGMQADGGSPPGLLQKEACQAHSSRHDATGRPAHALGQPQPPAHAPQHPHHPGAEHALTSPAVVVCGVRIARPNVLAIASAVSTHPVCLQGYAQGASLSVQGSSPAPGGSRETPSATATFSCRLAGGGRERGLRQAGRRLQ